MVHIPSIRIRTKSFLFKKYNGKEEAFKAAVRWRDNECKKLNIIINNHSQSFGKCKKNAKGYSLRKDKEKNPIAWDAYVVLNKKLKKKSFSVNKYGFDHARDLARQQRILWKTGELIPVEQIE